MAISKSSATERRAKLKGRVMKIVGSPREIVMERRKFSSIIG